PRGWLSASATSQRRADNQLRCRVQSSGSSSASWISQTRPQRSEYGSHRANPELRFVTKPTGVSVVGSKIRRRAETHGSSRRVGYSNMRPILRPGCRHTRTVVGTTCSGPNASLHRDPGKSKKEVTARIQKDGKDRVSLVGTTGVGDTPRTNRLRDC